MADMHKTPKKLKIDFSLTNKQKNIFAIILTLVTIIVLTFVYIFFFVEKPQDDSVTMNSEELIRASESLSNNLSNLSPEDIFYQDVTFEDLDIYPMGWIERNFTSTEMTNQLIAGPTGDPDNDGLSNKLEFIYGSNPKNADSLCNGVTNTPTCTGKNDKQNVDANISPLTGLSLDDKDKVFSINFQNKAVIESLKNSFDSAAREGLDFPTLYQLSKTVDYTTQVNAIAVKTEPETRQNLIDYAQYRITLANDVLGSNELQSLSRIYSLVSSEELTVQKAALTTKRNEIIDYTAPESVRISHQLYVFIFDQLLQLVTLRLEGITTGAINTETYQKAAKESSIAIVWAYRILNESTIITSQQ